MKRGQLCCRQIKEETSSIIKLKDLAKLVSHVQPSFKDLDLLEDDPVIIVADSDEDKDDEVHATKNVEIKDTSVPKSSSLSSTLLSKYGTSQRAASKVLKTKFSNILFAHDFSSSLPTELKDLSSKFDELTKEVKGLKKLVHELDIELPGDLKEILTKLEEFTKTITIHVASVQPKLKTLDSLPGLLLNVTKALNMFTLVLDSASSKARDKSVPSAGQADTRTVEGEKDTNQATISYLFQRIAKKNVEDNLNKNNSQTKTTSPPIPPVITNTQMQSPSHQPSPKGSSHLEGEHIKEDKGKKALSSEDAKKESTDSDSGDETHVTGSMKLEEDANAKAAKQEGEVRKAELVDLLSPEVDPLDKLNDLANKKRKHADDIHDYFKANKRLKSPVQYKDHLSGTVLNELVLCPGLDDHAMTFSSLLLTEIDKRNLNPLKKMRVIE
ncbi:hypothetical protein Tco_0778376 [Tanacetum coccineum]